MNDNEKNFWARIEAKYHKREKSHAECRLCGDMVSVIAPDDVFEALEKHERTHPEYAEWVALGQEFSIWMLHAHDCVFVKCACICGCQSSICVTDLPEAERSKPRICDMCSLYQGRGHVGHRLLNE